MQAFIITNTVSGHTLGVYPGDTAYEAYEAMARDAGYDDVADRHEQTESDGSDMQIDALDAPLETHEAFQDHSVASDSFVRKIESYGGYDMSRTEIERIAMAVADLHAEDWERAEAFHNMWRDESWWLDQQDNTLNCEAVRAALRAGDAGMLARHTISGMLDNYDYPSHVDGGDEISSEAIACAVAQNWSGVDTTVADAVEIYCEPPTYSNDGETLAPLSDDLTDAIIARVDAWMIVARQFKECEV